MSQKGFEKMCRICFGDNDDSENPLVQPCKCIGSMGNIHIDCLRQWLSRKENVKNTPNCISYTWKAYHCELCKHEYNDKIKHKGKEYSIFMI